MISFTLNGQTVQATEDETLFDIAKREGKTLPHLCSGYHQFNKADGNCRLCVVEVEGERTLSASCMRKASDGMVVNTHSARVEKSRKMVMELLMADQPTRETCPDPKSHFWKMADEVGIETSRFEAKEPVKADITHPAIAVDLNACIHCTNCVRACQDLQSNDVLGMAARGGKSHISFDQNDLLNESTCVACGECVQSCPTGALLPRDPKTGETVLSDTAERTVNSLCPFCGVGCQLTYHIKDDQLIKVEGRKGPANEEKLCVKGRFGFDYIHHPHRLTKPLIRKEGAAKEPIDPANPLSHFREASWEEALDKTAQGFKRYQPSELAGFGSAKGSNEEAYLFQKIVRAGFGTNNVDHCTRLCHASSVSALMEGIGSAAVTAPFMDALKADVIIVIGSRPAQNHPVAATYIKEAVKKGAKLIVMDPRRQGLTRFADHMVQFKSGSDVALLNAMIHTIIEEGLVNQDYIEKYTEDFDKLADKIKDFSPDAMQEICGIKADEIRTIARTYAKAERSLIFWGMGVTQHVHGTDNVRSLMALALITGHMGRDGTGLHPLRGQNNVQGASDSGLIPMVYPNYQPVASKEVHDKFEEFWQVKLDPEPGLTVVEIMHEIQAGKLKSMYIMGENPAMSDPDANNSRKSLSMLDHLVVQDIFLTETAMYADIILPASAFPEKTGTFTNTNRQIQMARQALNPPGQAKQDLWIICEIAKRMGLDWSYESAKDVHLEMEQIMGSLNGITWDRLEAEDCLTYPNGQAVLFGEGFPTANSKGRIVPTDLIPPDEVPDTDYPFVLTTGRMLEHWHTGAMTRRAAVLNQIEAHPVASLNPKELNKMGLEAGDMITVSTRRGTVDIHARPDRDVPTGMVFIPFCFKEAAANLLTNPQLDPYGKIPEVKTCAAKITPSKP
ncbi:NAD-dependent formate dehydrogenase iron-sulfur protein [Candidatus Terasakiella magnetica]|uniref:NAD-dependent formate dehydrogenase iron-sulfur protein n=1 Tax=Candidatus Terasakiella magnetica TaxID=1867952 RepID=A0A1C3RLN7_9PROT|nr:formate dehydrogenase subunit alpha [Candidatus Terasakiella magnetica]SCA58194.1 NAD-dependent formate dehydrogenase iron-sulfur protein [Candidatus Terasakiella magnetica]